MISRFSLGTLVLALSGSAFGNISGVLVLSNENGGLIVRSDDSGVVLGPDYVYQAFFTTELEWDERQIYNHVDANGTPIDANGNPAYTGAGILAPHLLGTAGSKNFLYNVDDFGWKSYANAFFVELRPGDDGSVDNKNISLQLTTDLKVWNGSGFVATGGENLDASIWQWTTTVDDGIDDVYDTYQFPDGGWYAYITDTASADGSNVAAGSYQFAPGDQYRWLFQLTPDANGNRDPGVYLLGLNFKADTAEIGISPTTYMLMANGLGVDLTSSLQHPEFIAARNALTTAVVPLPSAFWLFGGALTALLGARKKFISKAS